MFRSISRIAAGGVFATLAAAPALAQMALTSPDLASGGSFATAQVLNGFGCTGGNISPALHWSGAPAGTQSFVVTLYDPDAPTGSGWWHWVVFDIPAGTDSLPAGAGTPGGALPPGALEARSDFGSSAYGGPCPPAGDKAHRYVLTVYALKVAKLPLDKDASGAMVGFMTRANSLASASLTVAFGR